MDINSVIIAEPNPKIASFRSGDRIKVNIRVREGDRERLQTFQGDVIRKRGGGPGSTFTVRRVSHGTGVERTFPLHSPSVESVEVVRHGLVRQSRLYYLRGRHGKSARIKEDRRRSR